MKTSLTTLTLVAAALTLSACNSADNDRTTSIPRGVDRTVAVTHEPTGLSAPPAPLERTPIPPNANDAAPGTDASAAFAGKPNLKDPAEQKERGASAEEERRSAEALDAAVKQPDTATADAAKSAVMAGNAGSGAPSSESTTTGAGSSQSADPSTRTTNDQPRHGTLSKQEEVTEMPKEGQANNYSSTDLEKDSGRPSDGQAAPTK